MDVNDKIEKLIERINDKAGGARVLAIEILVPSDVSFAKIKYLIRRSNRISTDDYEKFITSFLQGDDGIRSLYFLRYPEFIRYAEIESGIPIVSGGVFSSDGFTIDEEKYEVVSRDDFSINNDLKQRLENKDNRMPFWDAWKENIRSHIPIVRSTMWTYVNYRDYPNEGDRYLSSAYVLFDKPLIQNNVEEDTTNKQQSLINKFIQDFLISYSVSLFEQVVSEKEQLKNEKEQLSRDITLQIALAHYVKNSMSGLAYNQDKILGQLKASSDTNNFYWVTLGKIQLNIYNLINLYLQIRQNARAGLLMTKSLEIDENDNSKPYSLKNIILFVYGHALTLKNGLTVLLNGVSKNNPNYLTEQNLNDIIDDIETGAKLVTDTLKNNEQELPDSFDVRFLDTVSANLDSYKCLFDEKNNNHTIELTKSQFRVFYTAFNEIFENIYNDRNAMGRCYIKVNDTTDKKEILIISSNYELSNDDINTPIENLNLVDIDSSIKGNGLKIINQSVIELNGMFKHSKETITNNYEDTNGDDVEKRKYYYYIKLNKDEKV